MREELLSALTQTKPWLDRFTRFEYRKAFAEYTSLYGEAYQSAIDSAEQPEVLADAILDALQAYWKKQLPWNRAVVQIDSRQMVILYLSPMLIQQGNEAFSEVLQNCWGARWPKSAYRVAPYEKLLNGFRNSVLGIDLANKHYDEDQDL